MKPWTLIGYVFLGLLGIAGVFGWNRHKDGQLAAATAAWRIEKVRDDSILGVRIAESYQAGLANAKSVPIYLAGKDRIIHDATGTPAEQLVKACFEIADQRISKCEASRKADSATIVALKHDLATTEAKPEPKVPRFVPFGEALYDFNQRVPVIRAGATARLIGPVSLSVAGEYAAPQAGKSDPQFRALLGARVNF